MRLPLASFPSMYAVLWASVMVDGRCDPVRDTEVTVPAADLPEGSEGGARGPDGGAEEDPWAGAEMLEPCGGRPDGHVGRLRSPPSRVVPTPGRIVLTGGDEAEVVATVTKYTGRLRFCYGKARRDSPDLTGTVDATWQWEDGLVPGTPVVRAGTPEIAVVSECIVRNIQQWKAPPDTRGEVSWTFRFELHP